MEDLLVELVENRSFAFVKCGLHGAVTYLTVVANVVGSQILCSEIP